MADAAWDDVRAGFEGGEFAGVCEFHVKQLAALVELRGGDWRSTAQRISRILHDDRFVLAEIGAIDRATGQDDPHAFDEPAGLALEQRLNLAREQINAAEPTGDLVAWVCFRNASLRGTHLDIGEVEFFGHQMWPEGIARGDPHHPGPRDEFADEWHKLLFRSMPDEPFVLARVPLGHGRLTGAVERARGAARDLIRAAQPDSEWVLQRGAAIHVSGREHGWFGDPIETTEGRTTSRFSPEYEPTSARLASLDRDLVHKLLVQDPQAHAAVRDIEWAEAMSQLDDPPQRLALSTRLVERSLPAPHGQHWTQPVRRYLKEWWAEQQARRLIADTATGAVDLLDSIMSADRTDTNWGGRLLPFSGGLSHSIRLDETLRCLDELINDLPEQSLQRSVAEELARHSATGQGWLKWLRALDRDFDILLARLVRQRNLVLHGGDTVAAVLASVVPFALELQGFVIGEQLEAARVSEPLLTALERNRIRLKRVRLQLEANRSPSEAMFQKQSSTTDP